MNRRSRLTIPSMFKMLMWDVKEPTHSSKRVGREVPGVVAVVRASGRATFAFKRAFAHMRYVVK